MSLASIIKSIRLSWREHKGVQLATLVVLTATFTVVVSIVSLTSNLRHVLNTWGDSVQMTAYLKDDVKDRDVAAVSDALNAMAEFKAVTFVTKDEAKVRFSQQMSSYASGLLTDAGLENPFPASFQMAFARQFGLESLSALAARIHALPGIEEVSYGQDWIQNYAALVNAFKWSSLGLTVVLILGSLLVVSNSIRASIDRRREEIEILKLVGATTTMIRRPFVVEGAFLGALATGLAVGLSYLFYLWEVQVISENLAFTNIASQFRFLPPVALVAIAVAGTMLGAFGSYACIFKISANTPPGGGPR